MEWWGSSEQFDQTTAPSSSPCLRWICARPVGYRDLGTRASWQHRRDLTQIDDRTSGHVEDLQLSLGGAVEEMLPIPADRPWGTAANAPKAMAIDRDERRRLAGRQQKENRGSSYGPRTGIAQAERDAPAVARHACTRVEKVNVAARPACTREQTTIESSEGE